MPDTNDSKPASTRAALALILIALIGLALTTGCSASVTAGKPASDQAAHQAAVDAARAQADLTAAQAFSATLASQARQVDQLVASVVDQAAAWQSVTLILIALIGLALVIGAGLAVVALILAGRRGSWPTTRPAAPVVYVMPANQAPELGPGIRHRVSAPSVLEVARYLATRERAAAALPAPVDVDADDAGEEVTQ